jgi:hypothetical protein
MSWETFTYPRLLVGLGWFRGRKFILSPQVKVRVLGICVLNDTFVIILLFTALVRCLWFNLCSVDILGFFCDHSFRWDDLGAYRYVVNFPDFFLFSRAKFSFFVTFYASVLGTLFAKGTAISITRAVLFYRWALYRVCWNLPLYQLRQTSPNTKSF